MHVFSPYGKLLGKICMSASLAVLRTLHTFLRPHASDLGSTSANLAFVPGGLIILARQSKGCSSHDQCYAHRFGISQRPRSTTLNWVSRARPSTTTAAQCKSRTKKHTILKSKCRDMEEGEKRS